MSNIKKGSIVTRYSYGNDIVFVVEKILKDPNNNKSIAILKGLVLRIEATAPLEDLKLENKKKTQEEICEFENNIYLKAKKISTIIDKTQIQKHTRKVIANNKIGLILHLDGDKKYAAKSAKVYQQFRLQAIVKNVKENKQFIEIGNLLNKYNPDILVITGHDGMIKKGYKYGDIYNYRNSRYFVKAVREARKWEQGENKLAIFAGACQSYYEAIMEAGANFASSPARILIDFMDPLIVARKIATTSYKKYITIKDVSNELRDGERGVSGIGAMGKAK